jgi:nucleoside-diphosphate-sugar epimerase
MRVLVTGSSGFIGPHLVEALVERGEYVVGLDRVPPSGSEPHAFVEGDLNDGETIEKALAHDVDLIAHLAAARADWGLTDEEYVRDNVIATRSLIEAGEEAGVTRWMVYSTVGVFGPSDSPLDDSAPRSPQGIYGETKAEAEELFEGLSDRHPEMEVTLLRPSAVYGPGNPDNTNVYRLIDAIYRRRFLMIGDGENTKTVSYLPNMIEATLYLMDRMAPGVHKYTYVDSPALTTRDLVDQIYRMLDRRAPRMRLPLPLARSLAYPSDLLARVLGVDLPITSSRIQKFCRSTYFHRSALDETGFVPRFSPEEALAATVDWYLDMRNA